MKKIIAILLSFIFVLTLVSCNVPNKDINTDSSIKETTETESLTETTVIEKTEPIDEKDYIDKTVNIFREKDKIDNTIDLRFYNDTPHVPYISVSKYYKEFFKQDYAVQKNNSTFTYFGLDNSYLKFNIQDNIFMANNLDSFSTHPDFQDTTSKTYLHNLNSTQTTPVEKSISLNSYNITLRSDGNEVYVPITFLSSFSGVGSGYNVAYNGVDIYVLDYFGELANGETRNDDYFGDTYYSVLSDLTTERYPDMAEYTYGQLCFDFDYLRGFTKQLFFGDNNLLSLGLNGLLEAYYPTIKSFLLSLDKTEYYMGLNLVFIGLYDGGHTSHQINEDFFVLTLSQSLYLPEFNDFYKAFAADYLKATQIKTNVTLAKMEAFDDYIPRENKSNVYHFDPETKIAYICFDQFNIDYDAWDYYYNNGMKPEDIPIEDAYAFIRKSFYQALDDGAENVIIDVSTNGGGNTDALNGIVGLINHGKSNFVLNDTFGKSRFTYEFGVDIDLDGDFDEDDVKAADSFTFEVSMLTSPRSFSCGNLLPSILKELGCKIIGITSGGGSCSISYVTTPDGIAFFQSSAHCLSNENGDNIDGGVECDFEIEDFMQLYDFVTIASYFNSLNVE